MPQDWPEDYISNYLIPFNRTDHIRPEAVYGIQRESSQINLDINLTMDVLVAKGNLEESLIMKTDLDRYRKMCEQLSVKEYFHSGHNIKGTEKESFYKDIVNFLNNVER